MRLSPDGRAMSYFGAERAGRVGHVYVAPVPVTGRPVLAVEEFRRELTSLEGWP